MTFRFSLQPLLRLRESEEHRELHALGACIQRRARIAQGIAEIKEELRRTQTALETSIESSLHCVELQFETRRMAAMREEHTRLQVRLRESEEALRAQQNRYRAAMQMRQILENLRERRLRAFLLDRARRESNQSDELFLIRRGATPQG